MPLSAGTKLGPYEILAPLGSGGMGEVYRARDAKLNRDVAIKVLPAALAGDAQYMQRFEHEARVLASLNHPNIATVYGIEQGALVMELVEGDNLRGPLPLDEAIPIARQITEGLEAAHERGIVHRDLKPANIKITPAGVVKILDFGLAKSTGDFSAADSAGSSNSLSPTVSLTMTQAGMILGTAAYMSPEQARGKPVDQRADIWAFGVVLYEMLTGRQLFGGGETVADTLASVMKDAPDLALLPAGMPANIRRALQSCLRKDVKQRLRDIADARLLLDEPFEESAGTAPPQRRIWKWLAFAASAFLAVSLGALWRVSRPVERPLIRFSVDLGPDAAPGPSITALLSPDGTRVVFHARRPDGERLLGTRLLDQPQATLLAGTENASGPFFSPDSKWIGFFADQKLKKIAAQGGAPITLCSTTQPPRGADWGEDGNIIASLDNLHLFRVSAAGGEPVIISRPEARGERTHRWPQILPGGESVLFTGATSATAGGSYDYANVETLSLKTGQIKVVQRGGYYGRYTPSGHLIFIRQGTLYAVPFDSDRLETRGVPAPVIEEVAAVPSTGAGQFDFSRAGIFVYSSGKPTSDLRSLVWVDSNGVMQPLHTAHGIPITPSVSPDGKRLAYSETGQTLTIYEPERDVTTKLSFPATPSQNRYPIWAPDSAHLVYGNTGGEYSIWWTRADGSGQPVKLFASKDLATPFSFAPGGTRLAFGLGNRLWTLPLDLSDPEHPKTGTPEPLPGSENQWDAAFSPDGRWLAYTSWQSTGLQVFVEPFPPRPSGGRWQISSGGGRFPIWSPKAREIYYVGTASHIMAAAYSIKGDTMIPEKPRQWTSVGIANTDVSYSLAIAPDGRRFVILPRASEVQGEGKGTVHVTVLLNFFDELRRRVPTR